MIVENIRRICAERGLSINRLEIEAEISSGNIVRWNTNIPSVDKVQRVADVLGCTVDELINDNEQSE